MCISLTRRIAGLALLTTMAGTAPGIAQTTWTMASGNPENNFLTQNLRIFAEDVAEATDGALEIDLRPNDELIRLDTIKRAVQSGQIPIGEIRLGVFGNENAMYLLDGVPYLAADYEQARALMEAQEPYLDDLFAGDGMMILGYSAWPGQGFFTDFEVTDGSQFEGVPIRIYSQSTQDMAEQLGFQATILPFAEVPQAFSTGLIDALFTSAQTGIDIQAWDYTQFFTYAGAILSKNAIIVNRRAFDALEPDVQEALLAAGEASTQRGFEMSAEANEETIATLEENGMTVSEASSELVDRLTEIGERMTQDWADGADEAQRAVLDTYRAAIAQ